ncbi:unnamed protein product [Merluccius merluccius]
MGLFPSMALSAEQRPTSSIKCWDAVRPRRGSEVARLTSEGRLVLKCSGVTCPTLPAPSCPEGSVLTKSYTPPAGCCPSLPPQCTCDLSTCRSPPCPAGWRPTVHSQASGLPGDCCDVFECQKGNCGVMAAVALVFWRFTLPAGEKRASAAAPVMGKHGGHCRPRKRVSLHSRAGHSETPPPSGGADFIVLIDSFLADVERLSGSPGTVSPKCVHNGKDFSEGEVYRMDPCWLCQCRGGISFCSKAECAELDCENFYVPEGECCPVCIDVELLSMDSTKASCWVNNKLLGHEEQWKEDDCTFCQCVDGEPHCTAMACKQSCQNPVKIPGECCPFCEEPSYETVSPLLCPPLENCSLSVNDCPYGFLQDSNGCLLCQCLNNDSCPDLERYCSLQCPMGYEKDDYGCEVCECSVPKCRPLTCSKTCPYGYVRNKHGCEMCRCVKCPPFTCDKHCSDGYRQNRKGCSICMCKDSGRRMPPTTTATTTTAAPAPSQCFTSNGQRYEEGESWHDGCRDCYCQAGREMCVLISCPVPSCSSPVVRHDQCCPTCEDESGSGQPVGMDLCRAPGGELYVEGETWNLDECTQCTCRKGRVLCDTEVCPPALCPAPTKNKDTCCHVCSEVVMTTTLTTMVSTPASETQAPTTVKSVLWITTATPEPPVVAVTDALDLGENYPSQTEMAHIYQSAAWILAALLLIIIVFIIAVLLINKKKKWVQMSCYSAPKKTVILKKHVNKNSVVYMEPSKENKFQNVKNDCGIVNFSPETGSPCGERMTIPRAKLNMSNGRVPH